MAQFNLMGDPEVPIWVDIASSFTEPETSFIESSRELIVDISNCTDDTSGTVITLHGPDFYQRVATEETEEIHFSLPNLEESLNLTITLSKDGLVPLQKPIEIPPGSRTTSSTTVSSTSLDFLPLTATLLISSVVILLVITRLKIRGRV
jgi:hypothetical protein